MILVFSILMVTMVIFLSWLHCCNDFVHRKKTKTAIGYLCGLHDSWQTVYDEWFLSKLEEVRQTLKSEVMHLWILVIFNTCHWSNSNGETDIYVCCVCPYLYTVLNHGPITTQRYGLYCLYETISCFHILFMIYLCGY